MSICNISSEKGSNWDACRIASVTLSAIGVALAIIFTTTLYLLYGANYYVYGAAGLGVISLVGLALSLGCCKAAHRLSSSKSTQDEALGSKETNKIKEVEQVKEITEERVQDGVQMKKITLTLEHFDHANFKKWLMAEKKPANKKELFKHTLLAALNQFQPKGPITLSYYQASESKEAFQELLKGNFGNKVELATQREWYHYSHEGHSHIDFANAFYFGGGWLGSGNVQEERMFFEFFSLALLAYMAKKNGKEIYPVIGDDPAPFMIPNMKRDFAIDNVTYGHALYKVEKKKIEGYVSAAPAHTKPVIITGIAARDWRGEPKAQRKYTLEDLLYHLKAAYLAFMGEKLLNPDDSIVITGAWGCGAFDNSEKMIIALQLLAAKMAGVKILLTGTNNPHNPNYTEETVEQLRTWIDGEQNPETILNKLLEFQKDNPSDWAPKK